MKLFVCSVWFCSGLLASAVIAAQPAATVVRPAALGAATFTAKTERIAADKTKLSVKPKLEGGANLRLLDATGKDLPATVSSDGTLQAVVDPRRAYIITPPPLNRRPLSAEGMQFPARYVTFTAAGAANLGGLFLRPARVPLTWDERASAYVTELILGYEFLDGAERPLAAPKTVTFFAEGSNARIQSDTVVIDRSGGSGYKRVTLSTGEFGGETHFTARAGPADEIKSSVSVRREVGALKLTLPSTEIAAFGVGSGTLTVNLLARDGAPLAADTPLNVQLVSRRLRLPATVEVPAGKTAVEIDFRSAGFGADEITAQSGNLKTSQAIRLIFPVAATVAAVGGGALGGIARYFRNRRKQNPLLVRRLIEGVLVGVIFVGAAWAGLVTVDVSTGILGTPFGAFVLAALSGYVGCLILDKVTNKTFKGLDAAP